MLIGIDGFEASVAQRVGVGRLAIELIRGLKRIDRDNQYRVYVPQKKPAKNSPAQNEYLGRYLGGQLQSKNWSYRMVRHTRLWSQATLPLHLFLDKPRPDVFLSPVHYAPRFCPCPSVIFVFDLSYIHFPDLFKKIDSYKLNNWTKYSVKKASKVLTISEASKADIIHFYNLNPEKVVVIYPGVKMKSKIPASSARLAEALSPTRHSRFGDGAAKRAGGQNPKSKVLKKHGIDGDYILYVGTLQPRKNLTRLIEAFKLTIEQLNSRTMNLVIVGKKGWMYEQIFAKVKELNLEKKVIFTGFVPDEDLQVLYSRAKCLVLVSLYEGFGLPVVEAMAHGIPVVVSNTSSLPEIVGDVGIMVDPDEIQDIANGILKIVGMSKTEYKMLSDRCKKRANKFSWEKTAQETLKVLEEVVLS